MQKRFNWEIMKSKKRNLTVVFVSLLRLCSIDFFRRCACTVVSIELIILDTRQIHGSKDELKLFFCAHLVTFIGNGGQLLSNHTVHQ